jgi:hypothetical protein
MLILTRNCYKISRTQCAMKTWVLPFRDDWEWQDGDRRPLRQVGAFCRYRRHRPVELVLVLMYFLLKKRM